MIIDNIAKSGLKINGITKQVVALEKFNKGDFATVYLNTYANANIEQTANITANNRIGCRINERVILVTPFGSSGQYAFYAVSGNTLVKKATWIDNIYTSFITINNYVITIDNNNVYVAKFVNENTPLVFSKAINIGSYQTRGGGLFTYVDGNNFYVQMAAETSSSRLGKKIAKFNISESGQVTLVNKYPAGSYSKVLDNYISNGFYSERNVSGGYETGNYSVRNLSNTSYEITSLEKIYSIYPYNEEVAMILSKNKLIFVNKQKELATIILKNANFRESGTAILKVSSDNTFLILNSQCNIQITINSDFTYQNYAIIPRLNFGQNLFSEDSKWGKSGAINDYYYFMEESNQYVLNIATFKKGDFAVQYDGSNVGIALENANKRQYVRTVSPTE